MVLVALAAPAGARAAGTDAVTMFSDQGDSIGGGTHRLYTPLNSTFSLSGSTGCVTVRVSGGPYGDAFTLDFAAPPGQTLAPGVYDRAQRAPFREAGRPGIDISGDGRGCNEDAGRFEVKDFRVSSSGTLEGLWIVYEQHCEGGVAALFGEVRLGAEPAGAIATAPALVRWPLHEAGGNGTAVPVTVVAAAPVTIASAQLAGADAAWFAIRLDDCSGKSLAAGSACEVWVRYVPTGPGTKAATLRLRDSAGAGYDVPLQGFTHGGRTQLTMTSDPGDSIGGGATWSYTPANAVIGASGTRRHIGFGIDGDGGDWWYGGFSAPSGDILAAGSTYENAARDCAAAGPRTASVRGAAMTWSAPPAATIASTAERAGTA